MMESPYQPPKSNLDNGITEPKSKTGWKIYCWLMVALHLLLTVALILLPTDEPVTADIILAFTVYPVTLLGLFGYAYDKAFFNNGFWKLWIFISLISDIYSESDIFDGVLTQEIDLLTIVVTLVILIPIFIFQYLGLYRYAYTSPDIWTPEKS